MAGIASGEIDTEAKKQKLREAYAEELLKRSPEWENLQVSLVAGGGRCRDGCLFRYAVWGGSRAF